MTYQPVPVTKLDFLAQLFSAMDSYEGVIARLTESQMLDTGMDNGSSFKDLLAHLSAWMRIETYWLEASLRGEQPQRYYPGYAVTDGDPEDVINHLNSAIYHHHKDNLLPEVLQDFRAGHQRLYALVEQLPEDTLNNPHAFSWWRGEPVWTSIAHNTYLHFLEHLDGIQSWLESALSAPALPAPVCA